MSSRDAATKDAVRRRYEEALESFVARVKQDRYIVAAILFGSLAYDEVWEKSDIDLMLIGRDDKATARFYALVEHGITLHAEVIPRSKFKAGVEGTLQGTWTQSVMARSILLFSTDESIQEYYENVQHVGSRDREMQILGATSSVISLLTKAEKTQTEAQFPTTGTLPADIRSARGLRRTIAVKGASEHNLQNISLEIPRDCLVVLTGVSGSGKSSLAFDTIYAEGQRLLLESLSSYSRRFVQQLKKPLYSVIYNLRIFSSITIHTERLYIVNSICPSLSQRHDMIRF